MSEIEQTLSKWNDARLKIKTLEEKMEKYKTKVKRFMEKNQTDTLNVGRYTVSKRNTVRTQLLKKDVPVDLWSKYSSRSSYESLILRERSER